MGAAGLQYLRVLYVLVFILGLGGWGEGRWEQEKLALLQLKPFFNGEYALYDWSEESSDCCKWERVECDATTGRVIGLFLENIFDGRYLNASLFLPFEELKSLSLSGNSIAGCLENEGFEKLASNLKKLEVFDLSDNSFNDSSILSSLFEFPSLKSLNLSFNLLRGPISHTSTVGKGRVIGLSLGNIFDGRYLSASLFLPFEELKSLSLSRNQIARCLDNEGFEKLATKLKKLEILDLSKNWFNDSSILSSLFEFPSLKSLNLSYNQLRAPISRTSAGFRGLSGKLSTIEMLDLKNNIQLDDNILMSLSELSSIKYLDLRGDKIIKSLDSLHGLIDLEVLGLTFNIINSSLLSSLGPFSKFLKHLYIDSNPLQGSIDIKDARSLKKVRGSDVVATNNSILLLQQSLSLFPSLNTLHFESDSYIDKTVAIQELGNFTNLEKLEVHDHHLPIKFIEGLRTLTRLEELYLEYYFPSTDLIEDVRELTSLRVLSLSCWGTGNVSLSIQGIHQLKNLESLEIEEITLQNDFIEKIGALTSLKILSLPHCGLNGTLSTQDICQHTLLEKLDIRENELMGVLPDCFLNLTFLKFLNLSSNQFSGDLATSPLQSLTSIQYIDLSNNQFQIPSSLEPFFNHSKLKHFHGGNNHIYTNNKLHFLAPKFQLNDINLSCCGDAGPLPEFLFHQHELQYVDLSNINLTGEFPSWLLGNNTELKRLFLINNSLSGNFRLPFHSPMKLLDLDISKNFFDGHIPLQIGACLPGLRLLNISINSLNGSIPTSIGDMKLLQILDLSDNRLSGVLPENLATCCSFLKILALSNNNLQGQIFPAKLNLTTLEELYLDRNNFTGSIPSSLSNCSLLSRIDIGYNQLSGRIPRLIANLSGLEIFSMPNNHIEGPIPMELCQHDNIGVLDLSMNDISGTLVSCFGSGRNNHVHLSKNRLQGPIPKSICNSINLVTLDLGDNQFTGNIPDCIGNLSELHFLVLKLNSLDGEISNHFCQLDKLRLIDLSHNNLSGRIPNCLNVTTYEEINIKATRTTKGTNTYGCGRDLPSSCTNTYGCGRDLPSSCTNTYGYHKGFTPRSCTNTYGCGRSIEAWDLPPFIKTDGSIELTTKNRFYSYKGRILRYFSGIDLSSNKLTGEIPHEMGNFHTIVMLNLSHNRLIGSIPQSLSNLKEIESLDLSYNNLSGRIPFQFVDLYSLAYFNVSYNNLSGRTPPRTMQFATFEENSYLGNPLLCGDPLPKKCSTPPTPPTPPTSLVENEEAVCLIDLESFYVTFIVSYIMVLLSIAAVLYINPHWRRAWFYLIERGIDSCFYFAVDNILPRQLHWR